MQASKTIWDAGVSHASDILGDLMGSLLGWAIIIAILIPPFLVIYFLLKKLGYGARSQGAGSPKFQMRMQWSSPVSGQGEIPLQNAQQEVEAIVDALKAAGVPINAQTRIQVTTANLPAGTQPDVQAPAAPTAPAPGPPAQLDASLEGMPQWQKDLIEGAPQEGEPRKP